MKIFVGMPAYNEELIIGSAIRSVYDYVDGIFVVNGSKEGPSTDRTAEEACKGFYLAKVDDRSGLFIVSADEVLEILKKEEQ